MTISPRNTTQYLDAYTEKMIEIAADLERKMRGANRDKNAALLVRVTESLGTVLIQYPDSSRLGELFRSIKRKLESPR